MKMNKFLISPEDAYKYFGPSENVKYLYHYTNISALVNGMIVESPKKDEEICLWATHNQYMNDPSEFRMGENILKCIIQKLETKFKMNLGDSDIMNKLSGYMSNFYLACFSEQSDSLPMWNMYGCNGHGIALKFNHFKQEVSYEYVLKCEYDVNNIIHKLNILQPHGISVCTEYISLLPFIIKNEAYSYEQEVRFVGAFNNLPTKYRYRSGLAIPYKEIHASKDILDSIIVGPAADQERVVESLRKFLDDRGMQHVKVEKSNVPYRTM